MWLTAGEMEVQQEDREHRHNSAGWEEIEHEGLEHLHNEPGVMGRIRCQEHVGWG